MPYPQPKRPQPGGRQTQRRSFSWGLPALLAFVALMWVAVLFVAILSSTALADAEEPHAASAATQVYAVAWSHTAAADISPHLLAELAAAQEPVSFLAILAEQVDLAEPSELATASLYDAGPDAGPDAVQNSDAARRAAVYHALTATAEHSQAPLRAWLDDHAIPYRAYYLINMLEIQGDAALVDALRTHPDIARLVANPTIHEGANLALHAQNGAEDAGYAALAASFNPGDSPQTGIEFTRTPLVWDLGHRGQGIVVAGADTGVDWNHPALRDNYRGWNAQSGTANHDHHWLDAWRSEDQASSNPTRCAFVSEACDDWGHGSHTLATAAGNNDQSSTLISMAPDAQWIACRNMRANFGTPAKYTDCFQFFLAPYPQDGNPLTDGNPALGAHIVNNSWGCPASEGCDVDSLREVIENVRAAGIFVVGSAGNSGPSCSSVNTPPGHHAATFSVGAHNLAGSIALFSSRGPVRVDGSGRLKPNLTAPGVGIYSAYRNGGYATLSGTSMASPHVAGAVALLWSAVPALRGNIDLTEEILFKSATHVLHNTCDGEQPPIVPNNTFGYGRLDAFRATIVALSPWSVGVQVRAGDGTPLSDVTVELEDELTGTRYPGVTGADGWARWNPLYHGQYLCRIQLAPQQISAVGTSRAPAAPFPPEGAGEGSLTIGTCQAVESQPPPADSRLLVPVAQRN